MDSYYLRMKKKKNSLHTVTSIIYHAHGLIGNLSRKDTRHLE